MAGLALDARLLGGRCTVALALLVATAPVALAQTPPGASTEAVTPPRLVEGAAAEYPEDALRSGREATVVLRITVDVDGSVSNVEVVESAGEDFDGAAMDAARRSRFEPARRGDVAVAARVLYPVVFRLPEEAPPAPPEPEAPEGAPTTEPPASTDARLPAEAEASAGASSEVVVRGALSEAESLRQSADAVSVVDLRRAQRQTADLGEVLARIQGVGVRTTGGLGSQSRLSLHGAYDDQVRVFVDGIPVDLIYPFSLSAIPIVFDRVEVYRGVLPLRLAADALGGAIQLSTDDDVESGATASYQIGSFGTHRLILAGTYRHEPTGFFGRAQLFLDSARNDYVVDVDAVDENGRLYPASVRRFNDEYLAYGGALELGVVDRPWARLLSVRAFGSTFDKGLQHNATMTVPFGEAHYGGASHGAIARYAHRFGERVELEVLGVYARQLFLFEDVSEWIYDWFGDRVNPRPNPGELDEASDQVQWQNRGYGRALLTYRVAPGHVLRFATTPALVTRTGDERIQVDPTARDPLAGDQRMFTLVSGVEYQLDAFGGRLENIASVKSYVYRTDSAELLAGGIYREFERNVHRLGAANALRYRFADGVYAKASYEYATRLPNPYEVFGDGALVTRNLELEPEVGHNLNLGQTATLEHRRTGEYTIDVNVFLRLTDHQIVRVPSGDRAPHQNVYFARTLGTDASFLWTSPGSFANANGTFTYVDTRNQSDDGPYRSYRGDRIPSRPWLFGSWGLRGRIPGLPGERDVLEPYYLGRWVHRFYRGWESLGNPDTKQVVATQVTHAVGVSYTLRVDARELTATFEVDNLTDARVYDYFGVQRPGRAFYLKLFTSL